MGIKLLVLLAVGVAGLYVIHLLAQDYQKIRPATRGIFKRDINSGLDWNKIMKYDAMDCAKLLICQMAAVKKTDRNYIEQHFMDLIEEYVTLKQQIHDPINKSYNYGKHLCDQKKCNNLFPKCVFSYYTMISIIKSYG